ncbi:MAG: hypothetical protein R3F62_05680 [Planctomycetota bacterium]
MQVVTAETLAEFLARFSPAQQRRLAAWAAIVRGATWTNHASLIATFPRAGRVRGEGNTYTFRLGAHRLTTDVVFARAGDDGTLVQEGLVILVAWEDHADYDRRNRDRRRGRS